MESFAGEMHVLMIWWQDKLAGVDDSRAECSGNSMVLLHDKVSQSIQLEHIVRRRLVPLID